MVQLPHVFVSSRTPHVLEYPRGLLLEPVISKTGFSHPVDRFRLSLSGRFKLCLRFRSVWRNYYSWLLPRTRIYFLKIFSFSKILHICVLFGGIITAGSYLAPEFTFSKYFLFQNIFFFKILVCWMQILVCCLHLVC